MSTADSETDSEPPQKYQPFQLGPSEDPEWYEPGGFHPVIFKMCMTRDT